LIKRLFDMFPQALLMATETGMTPYDLAASNNHGFVGRFFMPKLTFEDNVRAFRKFPAIFKGCGKRLRSVIDVQCEHVAMVSNPTLMSTIIRILVLALLCSKNDKKEMD